MSAAAADTAAGADAMDVDILRDDPNYIDGDDPDYATRLTTLREVVQHALSNNKKYQGLVAGTAQRRRPRSRALRVLNHTTDRLIETLVPHAVVVSRNGVGVAECEDIVDDLEDRVPFLVPLRQGMSANGDDEGPSENDVVGLYNAHVAAEEYMAWVAQAPAARTRTLQDLPMEMLEKIGVSGGAGIWNVLARALPGVGQEYSGVAAQRRIKALLTINVEGSKELGSARTKTNDWLVGGKLHREGAPAREFTFNSFNCVEYHEHGLMHRVDGPAVVWTDPDDRIVKAVWYQRGLNQRAGGPSFEHYKYSIDGGPAVTCDDDGAPVPREFKWQLNGGLHRDGAPAREIWRDGKHTREWWYNGRRFRANGLPTIVSVDTNHYAAGLGSVVTETWHDGNGKMHRVGGPSLLARLCANDDMDNLDVVYALKETWREHGRSHRTDGPAVLRWWADGTPKEVRYMHLGKMHRIKGPAVQIFSVTGDLVEEQWVRLGVRDRVGGPAHTLRTLGVDAMYTTTQLEYYRDGVRHRDPVEAAAAAARVVREAGETDVHFEARCVVEGAAWWFLSGLEGGGNVQTASWFVNGGRHREGGPARVQFHDDGSVQSLTHYTEGREDCAPEIGPAFRAWYTVADGGHLGRTFYCTKGERLRVDGPAETWWHENGQVRERMWYHVAGKRDRADGPARETFHDDGSVHTVEYYRMGKKHRDPAEGPASTTFTTTGAVVNGALMHNATRIEEAWTRGVHRCITHPISRVFTGQRLIAVVWATGNTDAVHRVEGPAVLTWPDGAFEPDVKYFTAGKETKRVDRIGGGWTREIEFGRTGIKTKTTTLLDGRLNDLQDAAAVRTFNGDGTVSGETHYKDGARTSGKRRRDGVGAGRARKRRKRAVANPILISDSDSTSSD